MNTIVIATNNINKAQEYRVMLQSKKITIKTLADFATPIKINETGTTFAANALLKAQAVVDLTKLPVIADDSGLVVDALNGEPGVHSARYAGDHDDIANNRKLLHNLQGVLNEKRTAHFNTTLVALKPNGKKLVVTGELNGIILARPQGNNGFGYDPLFYVPTKDKSLAQLTTSQKNEISHRGQAMRQLMQQFEEWWQQA